MDREISKEARIRLMLRFHKHRRRAQRHSLEYLDMDNLSEDEINFYVGYLTKYPLVFEKDKIRVYLWKKK